MTRVLLAEDDTSISEPLSRALRREGVPLILNPFDAWAVEHAIRLSHEKYCSASIMLGKTAQITHDYENLAD